MSRTDTLLWPRSRGRWRTPTSATSMPCWRARVSISVLTKKPGDCGIRRASSSRRKTFRRSRVPHPRAQQRAHQDVVAPGMEAPLPRILAADAVADHDGALIGPGQQGRQLGQVELTVGVGESDALAAGRAEAGAQGGPVALVPSVAQDADARAPARFLSRQRRRVVRAAVVDDQDFVGAAAARPGPRRLRRRPGECPPPRCKRGGPGKG